MANLHTHVVSFAVEKAAKDAVGGSVATEEEKRLNFLRVSLSKSGVNDVDGKMFKEDTRNPKCGGLLNDCT